MRRVFIAIGVVGLGLMLGLPAAASAATPDVATFDTYSSGTTTATVEGFVNPNNESTTYAAEYDTESSAWCQSGTGSPAHTTPGLDPIPTDNSLHFVTVDLTTGLTEGTKYCAQLTATNGDGEGDGGQVLWTQGAPTADTFDVVPTSTGITTATMEGDVDPGGNDTLYSAEYDLLGSTWCATDGSSGAPAVTTSPAPLGTTDGSTFHDVSVDLSGLSPGASYCGQIVATNTDGTGEGGLVTWTQQTLPLNVIVTITLIGNGSGTVTSSPAGIDCGAGETACSATFPGGTALTFTATPAAGSTFPGWRYPFCSGTGACTIKFAGDGDLLVSFTKPPPPPQESLTTYLAGYGSGTVTSSPTGIDCGDTCTANFNSGSPVTLTATPDHGSYFVGWSGGVCSGTGTCTLTLASAQTVTATFRPFPLPRCTVKSTGSKVKLKGPRAGVLTLKVTCNQAVSFTLAGKVTIKTKSGPRTKTSHAAFKSIHGSVKPGLTRKVTMRVPKAALKKLAQHAAESVAFTLVAKTPNNSNRATASIKHLRG